MVKTALDLFSQFIPSAVYTQSDEITLMFAAATSVEDQETVEGYFVEEMSRLIHSFHSVLVSHLI